MPARCRASCCFFIKVESSRVEEQGGAEILDSPRSERLQQFLSNAEVSKAHHALVGESRSHIDKLVAYPELAVVKPSALYND